jgi:hypothetical protein
MMHEPALFPALSENRLIRRLAMLVTELDLDRRDFVIFGSGPLLAHGLRYGIRDLDIVARGSVWQHVCEYGSPDTGSVNGAPMALFWNGLIQFSQGWISDDWDADDLIDRAEGIQGWPFAQLTDVLAYKQMLLRRKDHLDIAVLHQAMLQPARQTAVASKARSSFRPRCGSCNVSARIRLAGLGAPVPKIVQAAGRCQDAIRRRSARAWRPTSAKITSRSLAHASREAA